MPWLMLPFSILITYTFIWKSAALFSPLNDATHSSWILCVFVCLCIAPFPPCCLVRLCGIFGKTSRIYRSVLHSPLSLSLSPILFSLGCRSFLCLSIKWSRINSTSCCCFFAAAAAASYSSFPFGCSMCCKPTLHADKMGKYRKSERDNGAKILSLGK